MKKNINIENAKLRASCDAWVAEAARFQAENHKLRENIVALRSEIDQLNVDIPALKQEMLNTKLENAQLQGFVKAIRERDDATSTLVDCNGTAVPQSLLARHTKPGNRLQNGGLRDQMEAAFGNGKAPSPWVIVGNRSRSFE